MTSLEAKVGTLLKREDGFLRADVWKRRSFLLDGSSLYCFKKAPELTPLGRILVSDAQIQVREAECTIFLTVLSESRIYRLGAETAEDTADWARAFELAKSGRDKSVIKMGYLHRQILGAWGAPRPLWFVLDRGALFYFRQPPDFSPTAVLQLDRSITCAPLDAAASPSAGGGAPSPSAADGFDFSLESGADLGKPTCWTLRAPTAGVRAEWVHAVGAAVEALPRAAAAGVGGAAAAATSIEQRGWLLKLTGGIGGTGLLPTYQPRYVILKGNTLGYFARPADVAASPRGTLRLVDNLLAARIVAPSEEAPCDFSVMAAHGGIVYSFRADEPSGARQWCEWLTEAIDAQTSLAASVGTATLAAAGAGLHVGGAAATPPPRPRAGSGLHTLRVWSPTTSGDPLGPCVSLATFDEDDPAVACTWLNGASSQSQASTHNYSTQSDDDSQCCANCKPQAARWRCNARLVSEFDVTWRRVTSGGVPSEALHHDIVEVVPDKRRGLAPDGGAHVAECFSAYMPSIDDVGCQMQVEYTPRAVLSPPIGTPGSSLRGEAWEPYVRRTRSVVVANADVDAQVQTALIKGAAEFVVVTRLGGRKGELTDSWCELRISRKGARLRSLQGPLGFLALGEIKAIPYGPNGEGDATVMLPTDLLQARISGADGAEMVVQAESAFMRDCIVHAMRLFSPSYTAPATPR
mmetsp:Transcript_24140/g.64764  ORF Transcript_24140/g.64764 Transcript_24140/m.64764 type:complete len:693 (+) Transcript_24140:53-2131(+)